MAMFLAEYASGETLLFTADSAFEAERDAFDAVKLTELSDADIKKLEAAATKARKAEENGEDE